MLGNIFLSDVENSLINLRTMREDDFLDPLTFITQLDPKDPMYQKEIAGSEDKVAHFVKFFYLTSSVIELDQFLQLPTGTVTTYIPGILLN